jgi:hypothetical protein
LNNWHYLRYYKDYSLIMFQFIVEVIASYNVAYSGLSMNLNKLLKKRFIESREYATSYEGICYIMFQQIKINQTRLEDSGNKCSQNYNTSGTFQKSDSSMKK